jgi:hypothetical protein
LNAPAGHTNAIFLVNKRIHGRLACVGLVRVNSKDIRVNDRFFGQTVLKQLSGIRASSGW